MPLLADSGDLNQAEALSLGKSHWFPQEPQWFFWRKLLILPEVLHAPYLLQPRALPQGRGRDG